MERVQLTRVRIGIVAALIALVVGDVVAVAARHDHHGRTAADPGGSALDGATDASIATHVYRDAAGGFEAPFAGRPSYQQGRDTSGAVGETWFVAVATDPVTSEVEEVVRDEPVDSYGITDALYSGIRSFAAYQHAAVGDEAPDFYGGHAALDATLTFANHKTLRATVIFYSRSRLFLVACDPRLFETTLSGLHVEGKALVPAQY